MCVWRPRDRDAKPEWGVMENEAGKAEKMRETEAKGRDVEAGEPRVSLTA